MPKEPRIVSDKEKTIRRWTSNEDYRNSYDAIFRKNDDKKKVGIEISQGLIFVQFNGTYIFLLDLGNRVEVRNDLMERWGNRHEDRQD